MSSCDIGWYIQIYCTPLRQKDFRSSTRYGSFDAEMSHLSDDPSDATDVSSGGRAVKTALPAWGKIVMGLLLLSLVVISLLSIQQVNMLQVQNGQLSNHSSDLDHQYSDLSRIIKLGETRVLADHLTVSGPKGSIQLNFTCQCFGYSGYLRVNWTSPSTVSFRVAQFNLNTTTPRSHSGDYRVAVSSAERFSAWFEIDGCPGSMCSATYSIVYHY